MLKYFLYAISNLNKSLHLLNCSRAFIIREIYKLIIYIIDLKAYSEKYKKLFLFSPRAGLY